MTDKNEKKKKKMELLKYKTNMNLHSLSIHSHHYSFISIWKKIVITFKRRKKNNIAINAMRVNIKIDIHPIININK